IGPEFGEHSHEVAAFDDIGSVGRASRRIIRAAMAIVGPESAVAEAAWRYVHRDAIVRSQFAAMLDDCHHVGAESGIPRTMKMRGWSWIDPGQRRVVPGQSEWPHSQPLRPEELLNRAKRKTLIVHSI